MLWQICTAAAVVVVGTTSATHPHNVKALADQWQNKVRTQKPVLLHQHHLLKVNIILK